MKLNLISKPLVGHAYSYLATFDVPQITMKAMVPKLAMYANEDSIADSNTLRKLLIYLAVKELSETSPNTLDWLPDLPIVNELHHIGSLQHTNIATTQTIVSGKVRCIMNNFIAKNFMPEYIAELCMYRVYLDGFTEHRLYNKNVEFINSRLLDMEMHFAKLYEMPQSNTNKYSSLTDLGELPEDEYCIRILEEVKSIFRKSGADTIQYTQLVKLSSDRLEGLDCKDTDILNMMNATLADTNVTDAPMLLSAVAHLLGLLPDDDPTTRSYSLSRFIASYGDRYPTLIHSLMRRQLCN